VSFNFYLKHFGFTLLLPIYFVFCSALIAVIFVDLQCQIIPDVISLPGIVIGFALSFVNPFVIWQDAGLGGGAFIWSPWTISFSPSEKAQAAATSSRWP
jgi:leader peptidase (prepilin peptidase)/N-methyltransferase